MRSVYQIITKFQITNDELRKENKVLRSMLNSLMDLLGAQNVDVIPLGATKWIWYVGIYSLCL